MFEWGNPITITLTEIGPQGEITIMFSQNTKVVLNEKEITRRLEEESE